MADHPEINLTQPFHYDRRAEFDRDVQPLLDMLQQTCARHRIPYNLVLQTASGENCDGIFHSCVVADENGNRIDAAVSLIASNLLHNVFGRYESMRDDATFAVLIAHPVVAQAATIQRTFREGVEAALSAGVH